VGREVQQRRPVGELQDVGAGQHILEPVVRHPHPRRHRVEEEGAGGIVVVRERSGREEGEEGVDVGDLRRVEQRA